MTNSGTNSDFDMKKSRLEEHPSGWMQLTRYETVRLIIDALLEAPPDYQFNKSELERRTGASHEAIRKHLPMLVDLGVVTEINDGKWPEYQLNDDGKVTQELQELSSALNSVLSGESKNVQESPAVRLDGFVETNATRELEPEQIEDIKKDNAKRHGVDDELVTAPPSNTSVSNAD